MTPWFKNFNGSVIKTGDGTFKTQGKWEQLSDTQINTMKSTMSSDRSSSLSKITSIKAQINSLKTLTDTDLISQWNDNTIASKEASIKSQELNIEKSKLDIKNLIKSYDETVSSQKIAFETSQKDIDNKERSLEIAKLNLSDLLKWPTDSNVKKAQNNIKQAELKLSTAKENLADYNLIAPFDWVVRKIDYMVWDNLSTDTWKFVYIENPNLLEITVMLDQIDIVSVKGKSEGIEIYELVGITKDESSLLPSKNQIVFCTLFSKGYKFYKERRWDEAIEIFREIHQKFGEDYTAYMYINRCKDFKKNPPAPDWNGIFVLKEK